MIVNTYNGLRNKRLIGNDEADDPELKSSYVGAENGIEP